MYADKKIFLIILIASTALLEGCALLGGGDEEIGTKNTEVKYIHPAAPFEEVSVTSADKVWQSKKTGNTIALNSLCKKYEPMTLDNLKKNMLSGFDDLKIEKTENVTLSDREAQRILASGKAEGVPITVNILILKKNNCTYDIAYIARTAHFEKEKPQFEKFIQGFQAP